MKVLDPGHRYELDQFDGNGSNILQFMKRQGPGYPGNIGTSPGTNIQETLRVLIDRIIYLNDQMQDFRDISIVALLRDSLWLLEERAAERHNLTLPQRWIQVEKMPTCKHCGHVVCHDFVI